MNDQEKFGFDFELGKAVAGDAVRREEIPMMILLMGDFSGRANRGICEVGNTLAEQRAVYIDVDNFEEVMGRMRPTIDVQVTEDKSEGMRLAFEEMEDFDPDTLYRKLDIFARLREQRKRLKDASTFAEAAAEMREWASMSEETFGVKEATQTMKQVEPTRKVDKDEDEEENVFQRLLGQSAGGSIDTTKTGNTGHAQTPKGSIDINRLIKQIVGEHFVPAPDPQMDQYVSAVDNAIADQMRRILRDESFSELEATWRSVWNVVTNVETDESLKVFLLDISKEELLANVGEALDDLTRAGIFRLLVGQTVNVPGADQWSVFAGNYMFGPDATDVALLASLGMMAAAAGACFIADGSPAFAGLESFADSGDSTLWPGLSGEANERWMSLRESAVAKYIGLIGPRVMMRLPYSPETDEVDAFEFRELASEVGHEGYVWGSAAFGLVRLLAKGFMTKGWKMRPGDEPMLDGLPAHIITEENEQTMYPPTEVYLTDRSAEALSKAGISPLMSYMDRPAARLTRYHSIANPDVALSGPWGN